MRIVVVGVGKVGITLAEQLIQEGHDVVILDSSEEVIQKCENELDALCICGKGANANVLIEAGIAKTDILIATAASDETNMLCCLVAKRLGAKYTIARIRDPEYNESLTLLQRELGIDMTINPERATALEISRILRLPFASNVETFAKGRVEMVEFVAHENDIIVGIPLRDLFKKYRNGPRVLYCAVERGDKLEIPNGDFIIHPNDRVHVVADSFTITDYFRALGKSTHRIRNVMLLGGGRISYYLSKIIAPMGMQVNMIELKHDKAVKLSEQLPGVNVICGDGSDQSLLADEGLDQMDAFVTLTDRDEENMMTGLYAVTQGVQKVIVKSSRRAYLSILTAMGLESVVSPRSITCSRILHYVRARVNSAGSSEKLYRLMHGRAEATEFYVREKTSYTGIPLKDLTIRKNILIAVIVRKNKVIVPFGDDTIEQGDSVLIVTTVRGISNLGSIFEN